MLAPLTSRSRAWLLAVIALAAAPGAQTDWVRPQQQLDGSPTCPLAYDSARDRTVLVVPRELAGTFDTWEWNGVAWALRAPHTRPSLRFSCALAYDAARRRVVLFGGALGGTVWTFYDDTWEWDGDEWRLVNAPTKPAPRFNHALAFDASRGRVVLFGGQPLGGMYHGDTWEWDGSTWLQRTPATRPAARGSHAMAYDSARARVVLFGGGISNGALSDTWEWDGANWSQQQPATTPSARSGHCMAYDVGRAKIVMFGGSSTALSAETWDWDGKTWSRNMPPTSPSARTGAGMVYEARRSRILLFGAPLSETWAWDGNHWTLLAPARAPVNYLFLSSPAAYDLQRGRVVMAGFGYGQPGNLAEVWEWDGSEWLPRPVTSGPQARIDSALAYDVVRARSVLFGGGGSSSGPVLSDTWEWDGNAWTAASPALYPAARTEHAMAYDWARGRTVLFGGINSSSVPYGDTWLWDGSSWSQSTAAVSPPARAGHAMAYDWLRGRVVLFGGKGTGANLFGDTWEWDGSTWLPLQPSRAPGPRQLHAMTFDGARGRVVLFAGYAQAWVKDTWEWDGTNWSPVSTAHTPNGYMRPVMVYDLARNRVVLYGFNGVFETWLYGDARTTVAAGTQSFGSACAGATGAPRIASSLPSLGSQGFVVDVLAARASAACAFGLADSAQALALGNGCTLYLGPAPVAFPAITSATGFAALNLPIPSQTALGGATVYGQAFVVDPPGGFGGIACSAGLRLTLGY